MEERVSIGAGKLRGLPGEWADRIRLMRLFVFFLFALVVLCAGQSAGVDRNAIRPIPPVGIVISATDRAELESHLQRLMRATSTLENHVLIADVLIADVLIYQEAVRYEWGQVEGWIPWSTTINRPLSFKR